MTTQALDAKALKEQMRREWDISAQAWLKSEAVRLRFTQPITDKLIQMANVLPGQHVLDVATGAGEPALTAVRRVGPQGKITGTDISPNMLAVARQRAQSRGITNVEFLEMDAEELKLPDNTFDTALCRFGIMLCPAPLQAAKEIHRVLKPGGRAAVSVWTSPERNPWISIPQSVLRRRAKLPTPPPREPGPFALGAPGYISNLLKEAGFRNVEAGIIELPAPIREVQAAEHWAMLKETSYVIRGLLSKLPAGELKAVEEEIISRVRDALASHYGFGLVWADALWCAGIK